MNINTIPQICSLETGGWRRGISPPRSHRSVRESHYSHGDYSQSVRVADIIIFGSQITAGSSLQHLDSILNL